MKELISFINNYGWDFIDSLRNRNLNINFIQKLKNEYLTFPINEILSLIQLQKKAKGKIPYAEKMVLSKKSLEQASSHRVAEYHAQKMEKFETFADLSCGAGIDFISIAKNKKRAIAVDYDSDILEMAQFNAKELKNCSFFVGKAQDFSFEVDAVFIDPDRRVNGKRRIEPEDLSPDWNAVLGIIKRYKNCLIKLSPAMDYKKIKLDTEYTLEFISVDKELKEILLCTGNFVTLNTKVKAVILPQSYTIDDNNPQKTVISEIKKFVYEPDPAIIRAHLIKNVAYKFDFNRIDEKLALLTSDNLIKNFIFNVYRVNDVFSFNLKKVNEYIKKNNLGILEIKTRGFSETVESFRKKLRLEGSLSKTLFIIKKENRHFAIFCDKILY